MKQIHTNIIVSVSLLALLVNFTKVYSQPGITENGEAGTVTIVLNPYEKVDWSTFKQYKAALHVHTMQSDGYDMVDDVVRSYQKAGFTILAISDHDKMEPNAQFERGRIDWSAFDKSATPYPKDPKPKNYPFNTTWPWTDFGGPDPKKLGMVGIEANEISYLHHMNSFFSSYGTGYEASNEDEQLLAMKKAGGLVIFNHPSGAAAYSGPPNGDPWRGGSRRSLEWYVDRFKKFSSDFLIGIDISGAGGYSEGLWDQLLARFMPDRPIWGFCTDDMHRLPDNVSQSPHTIFVLKELTNPAVREAMEHGQFYPTRSTQRNTGLYPTIERIEVDPKAGTITIQALNCDTIKWISAPKSLEPVKDYTTSNQPWPLGQVVHKGITLNYRETPNIKNYVRAELQRTEGGKTYRTFINPFGIRASSTKLLFSYSNNAGHGTMAEGSKSGQTSPNLEGNENNSDFKTKKIGNQEWMSENLNISIFRNGDQIPEAKTNEEWLKAYREAKPAWCYYDNDPENGRKYGKLYNWYAVNDSIGGLAPAGWHVPSNAEWTQLTEYLGGYNLSGTKMKSPSSWKGNGNGTNESGFAGLPGGYRRPNGSFTSIGLFGYWWSSTEYGKANAWDRLLYYNDSEIRSNHHKASGSSVRCIRD